MERRKIPVNFAILSDAINEKNHLIDMRDTYTCFLYKIFRETGHDPEGKLCRLNLLPRLPSNKTFLNILPGFGG